MANVTGPSVFGDPQPYRTAQAAVADRLRRAILSGHLPSGSRLLQATLARDMRTSTTPVREALRELAVEGLLDLDAHRGVVVHECRAEELDEIYRIRMLLEPVAIAATIDRVTDAELDEAERVVGMMEKEADVAEWAQLNARFHSLLTEASRLPILSSIVTKLRNLSTLYVAQSLLPHPDRLAAANREHRDIFEASRDRDVARAQEAELAHLRHTLEIGAEHLATSSDRTVGSKA
jgi:DNA-binding GntR family transcriptional regulator